MSAVDMLQVSMHEATGFGEHLRALRHQKGLTLRELATRVGLDFSLLVNLRLGVHSPFSAKMHGLVTAKVHNWHGGR